MKRIFLAIYAVSLIFVSCQQEKTASSVSNPYDRQVDSLLDVMSLDEKIGQLNLYNGTWEFTGPVPQDDSNLEKAENIKKGLVGGMLNVLSAKGTREAQRMAVENSRLGIPLIFGYDVIHGYKTMMPIPLAQAASWDPEVARKGAEVAAREAAASGLHWTFAPMVDVSRDARWGRIMESPGEDPYLAQVMARAWVTGYQGDDLSSTETIAACAKHFAAYGYAEAGRDYNTVEITRQTLLNVVFPPFKAAQEAGVATFMNAFNELNGIPATGHKYLQRDVLKGEWDFDGFVVSDWGSVHEMVTHGFAKDDAEAAYHAITAGSDMDMESRAYEAELKGLVESGRVKEALVDDAVRRILTIKYKLGLFEDPYKYCSEEREKAELLSASNLEVARDAARKSFVLLKNDKNLLPLDKNVKSIAVIGQLAESKDVPLGSWRAQAVANSGVSVLEGIRNAVGDDTKVQFAQGYTLTEGRRTFIHELNIVEGDESGFAEAIRIARNSEVVVIAIGEDCFQTGEGRSQVDISLKSNQKELLMQILEVNPNVIAVLMNGRPLAIPEIITETPAILETWFGGSEAGNAVADVIFGDYNPSGKLPVSFPYHVGQEPLYYARKNTGRPVTNEFDSGLVFWSHYTDAPNEAILPFGHGLSYSEFEYDDLELSAEKGQINVKINLKNVSDVDGSETVQVYIRDKFASEIRPVMELKDFRQVPLGAGEETVLEFALTEEDLGFYHLDGTFSAENGEFVVMVGGDSRNFIEGTIEVSFSDK